MPSAPTFISLSYPKEIEQETRNYLGEIIRDSKAARLRAKARVKP